MRSTSAVPRVISQLEDIFRMHQGIIIVYFTMKNRKNLERKSSADRITCFLPLSYNPLLLCYNNNRNIMLDIFDAVFKQELY
jgi:hypothetical protein